MLQWPMRRAIGGLSMVAKLVYLRSVGCPADPARATMMTQTAPEGEPHFVITMAEHTEMCGQLARAFGNDRFERLDPFEEVGWGRSQWSISTYALQSRFARGRAVSANRRRNSTRPPANTRKRLFWRWNIEPYDE
jgi:hypothetical protein